MIDFTYSAVLIGIMAGVTAILRFAPFAIFRKSTPAIIEYLGKVLPYAITGMLVIYCLKGVDIASGFHGLPEIGCIILVAVLHKWKHNTLLSIIAGTAAYMLIIQSY